MHDAWSIGCRLCRCHIVGQLLSETLSGNYIQKLQCWLYPSTQQAVCYLPDSLRLLRRCRLAPAVGISGVMLRCAVPANHRCLYWLSCCTR
jgi:hypothetical protein